MGDTKVWTVEIAFTEEGDVTKADAVLDIRDQELRGWGQARRNPADPDVPKIGEELAAARALSDLSHRLVHVAADAVESFEGRPVSLQL